MANLQTKISQLMTEKKISAIDIEKGTGLNRNTVYSIVAGTSKNPTAHNLQLIAKALDVNLESILLDDEDMQFDSLSHQQMQAFADAASAMIAIIIEKNGNFSLNKLISLIKEVYQYSIKIDPPSIDDRFIHWIVDKHNKP